MPRSGSCPTSSTARGWRPIAARDLDGVDGIWLLPGTPYRDEDAAYGAIRHCIKEGAPFLGTCGGFQYACVELARALAGITSAAHAENDPDSEQLVIEPLACSLYGERRTVRPVEGTRLASICGSEPLRVFTSAATGSPRRTPRRSRLLVRPKVGSAESGALHPLINAFPESATNAATPDRSAG